MYGRNERRGAESSEKGYQVREIFYTIQGEGPFVGMPSVFVRLTGCCFGCWFCDTVWDDKKDSYMSVEEIVAKVNELRPEKGLVVLTGGEPCRWDLNDLFDGLFGNQIQVETAGSFWRPELLDPNVTIVVSPKVSTVHPKILQYAKHWKYVVSEGDASPEDGLPLKSTQVPYTRPDTLLAPEEQDQLGLVGGPMCRPPQGAEVYLQPCDEGDPAKNAANMKHMVDIALKHGYRAGVQLHKIIGVA